MNIIDLSDQEIRAIADPFWAELIEHSNAGNYGGFTRHFASSFMAGANEIEMGKQFARSELARSLSADFDYLGIIRRGEHVTVLYRQRSRKKPGEWLGRLVLGYENGQVKIFGATLF